MATGLPPKYTGHIFIIVITLALAVAFVFMLYHSPETQRLILDIFYWIPGMSKAINLLGGAGAV